MAKNGDQKANSFNFANLREASEYKLKISPEKTEELKKKSVDELVEELRIHQVELEMQNEELRKNQILLEKSHDKYIDLYDFAPVGYFVFNHLSLIEEVNLKGASFIGIERHKLLNKSFRQFVYPDNHEIWDQHIHNVLKHDEKQSCDLLLVKKDGHSIYVRLDSIQLHTEVGKNKIRTAMSDITERKQAEESAKANHQRMLSILDANQNPIYVVDPETYELLYVNRALVEALGEPDHQRCYEHLQHRSSPCPFCTNDKILGVNFGKTFEWEFQNESNQHWYRCLDRAITWPDGRIVRYEMAIDITERKCAEEALRESEQRLNFYVENSPMGVVEWDTNFIVTRWTGESEKIFGWSAEETIGKPIMDLNMIYEEDIPIVQNTMKKLTDGLSRSVVSSNRNYTKERRIIYCEWYNTILYDQKRNMISVISQILDITERKKAEMNLKESEGMLNVVFDNSPIALEVYDRQAVLMKCNNKVSEMFGVATETLIGKFNLRDDPNYQSRDVWDRLNRFEEVHHEIVFEFEKVTYSTTKTGVHYYYIITTPIPTNISEKVGYIMQIIDITERKQAEEAFHRSEEKYRMLFDSAGDAIYVNSEGGQTLEVNKVACEQLGYTYDELLALSIGEVDTNDQNQYIQERIDRLMKQGRIVFETTHQRRNGSHLPVEVNAQKIIWNGQPAIMSICRDITERKQSEKVLQDIIDKNPMSIHILNKEGHTLKVNEAHTNLFGSAPPPNYSFFKDFKIEQEGFEDLLERVKKGEIVHFNDFKFNAHDFDPVLTDVPVWIRMVVFPLYDSSGKPERFVLMHEDITDRKRGEELLKKSENEFRLLAEAMPQIVWITDSEGKNIYFNQQWVKYTGQTLEESFGHGWNKPLHPDDQQRVWDAWQNAIKNNGTYSLNGRLRRADGVYTWWLIRGAPVLDSEGNIVKWFGTCTDIDELKRTEDKLQGTLAKLKETQKQILLQEKLRSLGQMTSGICHDINNSLSPIMGYTEMLSMDQELMKKHDKKLANIIKSTKNIASTIGRLKEFYKVKLEDEVLTEKDINKIINSTIELTSHKWKNMAESTGSVITIKKELQKDLHLTKVDESELIEALTNVILNACDSMINGGTLTFRTYQKEANIVIEVQDTGMGMDEETLQRCLDPFYSTKGEQGTGLGLSMVFGVMERHKGEIKIESEKNKGTIVKLILPVDKSIMENDKIDEIVKDLKPLKILSVEDDKVISEMLKLILETKGNRVESALNGKVGLEIYKQELEKGEPFDLVITDLGMAEMDGNSLSKAIKEITPDTPVILLTGWGTLIDKNDYKTVDCLLKKPIMMEDLFKAIGGLFKDK